MRSRRLWASAGAVVLLMSLVSACSDGPKSLVGSKGHDPTTSASPESDAKITTTIPAGATGVKVNRSLRLDVSDGTFSSVSVSSKSGTVDGTLSSDKVSWQSTSRLQPG